MCATLNFSEASARWAAANAALLSGATYADLDPIEHQSKIEALRGEIRELQSLLCNGSKCGKGMES